MNAVWTFLSDPSNQQTLKWLGGGLVVVVSGVWVVVAFFLGRKGAEPSASTMATTSRGAIAAGRDQHVGSLTVDQRRGLGGVQTVLLVVAALGAVLLAAGLAGDRITARDGGVGLGTMSGGRIDVYPGVTGESTQ